MTERLRVDDLSVTYGGIRAVKGVDLTVDAGEVVGLIGPNGAVVGTGLEENTVGMPSVGECIASAVRTWTFPPPSGESALTVRYPVLRLPGVG